MGNSKTCPGCGKHCAAANPRCRFGQKYFAKHAAGKDKPAWERYVEQGGAAWTLLSVSRTAKKALKKGKITEDRMMAALNDGEKEQLQALLKKIDCAG